MWERTAMLESVNVFTSWLVYPENDNRSLQAKNRQQYGRTKIEVGPKPKLGSPKLGRKRSRAILSNLMPMVVKIVGSTPTIRTKDESEVVVSKHVKSNI